MAKKFVYGELTDLVLESIASLLIESGKYSPPPRLGIVLGNLIKAILAEKRKYVGKDDLKRVIRALEKRKILIIEEKNDQAYVYLDEKGESKVFTYSIKQLLDFKKKKKVWNGKWFFVFFDVPEVQRNKRDYLRRYLKKIGFYQYQQSVYIFPYDCEDEVQQIKKIVEGASYMKYLIAEKIEDENKIKSFFGLT